MNNSSTALNAASSSAVSTPLDPLSTDPSATESFATDPSATELSIADLSETDLSETDLSKTGPSETDPSLLASSDTDPFDILVIDDTSDNLRLLLKVLSAEGYSVRPSTSGLAAITAAQLAPPDLVLLDVKMPEIDGYEVCKRLKADPRTRGIPILFLTVLDDVADIVKGFEIGGVDYITKPVKAGELLARVKNQVQQHQLQKQLTLRNQALQQAIDQFKRTKIALRETEDRFATAFENSPLPLSLTSIPDGRYLNVNREYVRHTGYSRDELLGEQPQRFNFWVDQKQQVRFFRLMKARGRIDGFETQLRTKTGKTRDVILFLEVIQVDGMPYALTTAQDVTLRLADERQLKARKQELSEALKTLKETQAQLVQSAKMAALGNMVAGVAHEINTPVGTAITCASTLENVTAAIRSDVARNNIRRSSFENYLETAAECSELILSNLTRAGDLVHSFKQVAVDQSSLKARSFPVKVYLQEVITNLMPTLKETPHHIVLTGSDRIEIHSCPGAIAQVVTNLVMNSINHAYPDGKAGEFRLTVHQDPDQIILQYSDNGCGIPIEHHKKVFEPFFTTAADTSGSGLGLHLVYNLVTQRLKGTIHFVSTAGNGTTFTITLPTKLPASDRTDLSDELSVQALAEPTFEPTADLTAEPLAEETATDNA